MQIREAIIQYLALPNTEVLDEGIFYNVLKDLNAFEQMPASQHIMRAFVTKGYLKDIWRGKKGWQIQSRRYLIETLGFQPDKVEMVINEITEGFRTFTPRTISSTYKYQAPVSVPDLGKFKKYEADELSMPHPFKPDDFLLHVGDIVMVKNGIAKVSAIEDDYVEVKYIKQNTDNKVRHIYYDEQIDFIISPQDGIYLKAKDGKTFYVHKYLADDSYIKFIGTYADNIRRIILTPYTLKVKKFVPCSEMDFLSDCINIIEFEKFKSNDD